MDLPPAAPAELVQRAEQCTPDITPAQAAGVLQKARQTFPRTEFTDAWPSCVPGLTALRMSNGTVAYMDKSARYLLLGLVLDSATGAALDRQLDGRTE